jgi:DNA-directed RNA polymerase specialized sigma24 family protein
VQIKYWSHIPDEILLSRKEMEMIEMEANEFPMTCWFVFLLRDAELLTSQEVEEILGFSLPADMSRIHRARFLLRDKLSGYLDEWR